MGLRCLLLRGGGRSEDCEVNEELRSWYCVAMVFVTMLGIVLWGGVWCMDWVRSFKIRQSLV